MRSVVPALVAGLATVVVLAVIVVVIGRTAGASSSPAPLPATVPLHAVGDRLVADIEVGGAPLRVSVDTGSNGLRVDAGKVPPGAVSSARPAAPLTISGFVLTGTVARAPLRIGTAAPASVPLELVTHADCAPSAPGLPARPGCTGGPLSSRLDRGTVDGILGIGPRQSTADLTNPFWSLGAVGHTYVVHPGAQPAIVLSDPDTTGFAAAKLAPVAPVSVIDSVRAEIEDLPPNWRDHVPMCVRGPGVPDGQLCQSILPDTGTPEYAILRTGGPARTVPPGTPLTWGLDPAVWSHTTLTPPDPRLGLQMSPDGIFGDSTLGLPAMAHVDLRYDLAAGTIALRDGGP